MKKNILFSILVSVFSIASIAQKITFNLKNSKDTTAFLIRYYGKSLRYADTAELKKGVVEFDGSKLKEGVYKLYLQNKVYPDLIFNKKNIEVFVDTKQPQKSFQVKTSKENKDFLKYRIFMNQKGEEIKSLREAVEKEKDKSKKDKIQLQVDQILEGVKDYQNEIIKNNKGNLIASLIKSTQEVIIPEVPENVTDSLKDLWKYKYLRNHFFDYIDFNDDRMVFAPIIENKISYFLETYKRFGVDTLIEILKPTLSKLKKEGDMLRFTVNYITNWSEKSKIMGMDKLFLYMGETFYCPESGKTLAYWLPKDNLKKVCDKVKKLKRTVIGSIATNLILPDSTEKKWHHLYGMNKEYTVLYFWDPNCGVCKKSTPKLGELYRKKLRDRNVGIYAVAKATGDDFERWKKFIVDNNLTYLNVGLTKNVFNKAVENPSAFAGITNSESLNYSDTYDVFSTPIIFLLDKNKKIIAKQLSIAQLEDYLDYLQGKSDLPKLFKDNVKEKDKSSH